MFGYVVYWVWWISWRIVVSLGCVITIQNVIHEETGVWMETKPLLLAAVCLIVAIRIWSVKPDPHPIQLSIKGKSGED